MRHLPIARTVADRPKTTTPGKHWPFFSLGWASLMCCGKPAKNHDYYSIRFAGEIMVVFVQL
jgi:hypothetical protein